MIDLNFNFTAKCWLWQGKGAWHFVTLPQDISEEIKFFYKNVQENSYGKKRGWGAVRVTVNVGSSEWQTSLFPYSQSGAYILPIKIEVRKHEKIQAGDEINIGLLISL